MFNSETFKYFRIYKDIMEIKTTKLNNFMKKLNKIEVMLNEVKQEAFLLDRDFQESIKRGEKDIEEGKVTICKTGEELDNFFNLI